MPPVTLPGTPTVPQTLAGLSTGPAVGPLPTTPYAPANVAPLWMPAETPGTPPKIDRSQNQWGGFGGFNFGGGAGAGAGAGGVVNPRSQNLQRILAQLGVPANQQQQMLGQVAQPSVFGGAPGQGGRR